MKSEEKTPTLNSLALWLDTKTAGLLCASIFLATLLCVSAAPALADGPPPLIWNCWIGDEAPVGIYCIHDRSQLYHQQDVLLDDPGDELEAALLDQIYESILGERTAGLNKFVREHGNDLRAGALWIIPI